MTLYAIERDEEGRAKLTYPTPEPPSAEQLFRRRCYMLGITEQAKVNALWRERKAEMAARAAKAKGHRDE